ncbi:MAG: hypothetical protein KDD66_03145 [Bdellovibrionales bacterium]|nr:hypothetical protein [Bdellovibrionales bacterium]
MMKPLLATVRNAVSSYVDLTIKEPVRALSHQGKQEGKHQLPTRSYSVLKTISEQRKNVSPTCEFIAPVRNIRAHYLGSMDTAASYRRKFGQAH